jgi:hypothetical protein
LWGAPRIHGELLKLGFEIAESTVSKYMIRRQGPPSQTWRTFVRNHAEAIAAIDLFVVPTLTFECLFAFLVLGHGRRQLLWFAVTRNPTAEWLAQQMVEAFPWTTAPTYLVRDNDRAYGQAFTRRLRTMGIRDRPISPRSPWQNAYVERVIGTLRRECLDHGVPRTYRWRRRYGSCAKDEGRPLASRDQELDANRCKLLPLRAVVVSVAERAGPDPALVRLGETSESKPSMKGRKGIVDVETEVTWSSRDKLGRRPEARPERHPARRRRDSETGFCTERGNLSS